MANKIASLHFSNLGITVLIGELDGSFRSWFHQKAYTYKFSTDYIDSTTLKIRTSVLVEHAQREIHRTIDSWYFSYDISDIQISSIKHFQIPYLYCTKSSKIEIKRQIEEQLSPSKSNAIIGIEPIRYIWQGRRGIIKSSILPDVGTKLRNLRVDALVYRTKTNSLDQARQIARNCNLNVHSFIPSCFCYSYILPSLKEKKNVVIVDIGYRATKIMIYRYNILIDYQFLPFGTNKFVEYINKKYCIKSERKTINLITNYFAFSKIGDLSIEINSSFSKAKEQMIDLTKGALRKEIRKQSYNLHHLINQYISKKLKEVLGVNKAPIFVVGNITNKVGYQNFLDKYFSNMRHLNINRIENLDNEFTVLLGMMELLQQKYEISYNTIDCVSDKNYNALTRLGSRISKHTDRFSKIFIGG